MDPEGLHRRLRLISVVGVLMSISGFILIALEEVILLGVLLLIVGMIMASTFKTAMVLKMRYELTKGGK